MGLDGYEGELLGRYLDLEGPARYLLVHQPDLIEAKQTLTALPFASEIGLSIGR